MGDGRRFGALGWVLLSLLAASFVGAAPAAADGKVNFADNQALVVDLGRVPPSVQVLLVNSATPGTAAEPFTLVVTGDAARYLRPDPLAGIAPPGLKLLTLTVLSGAVPCTGTLVLSANDSSLARLPVQLVGVVPGGPASNPSLVPGSFDTLSVPVTSRIPSFFRPMPSTCAWGFALIVVFALTVGLCVLYIGARPGGQPVRAASYGALAMVGVVASLVLLSGWVGSLISGAHHGVAVGAKVWQVQSAPDRHLSTTLVGSTGKIATATLDKATLSITGLPGAGTYTGTAHTSPTGTSGDIKITATVRDWWPYAFLTIAGGVLLGYLLSRFYGGRPAAQLRVRIAELRREVLGREAEWHNKTREQSWSGAYKFENYAMTQLDAAGAEPDVVAAGAQLDALAKLSSQFEALRFRADNVAEQREQVCAWFDELVDPDALATPAWLAPVVAPLDLTKQDPATTAVVTNRAKDVDVAEAISTSVSALVDRLLDLSQRIFGLPSRHADGREQLHADCKAAATELLRAGDASAVEAVSAQLDRMADELSQLETSALTPAASAGAGIYAEAYTPVVEPGEWSTGLQLLAGFGRRAFGRLRPSTAAPLPDADHPVTFTVSVTPTADSGALSWYFSDGTREAVGSRPAGQSSTLIIEHQFPSNSVKASAVIHDSKGSVLGSTEPTYLRPGPVAQLRAALSADSRVVTIMASLLAVGSGMVALYLNNTTWGSSGDYVIALLWGSATAEGLKAVVNLAGKRWPITA